MSLRTVHLAFILAAIVFADMLGAWGVRQHALAGDVALLWLGIASLLGGLVLTAYALFFVRDMDRAGVE